MCQAFLRSNSHLKPCWSRGSKALLAGTVHMLYFKYNSRQNVEVEGKGGNTFIFGLRKQCDTWQAWISFGEAVLYITEIKFDHCWRKTEIPQPGSRAVIEAVNVCCELGPDILNTLLGQLLRASAMWMLWPWRAQSVGRGWQGASRTVSNQRLWTAPNLWDHFPWY